MRTGASRSIMLELLEALADDVEARVRLGPAQVERGTEADRARPAGEEQEAVLEDRLVRLPAQLGRGKVEGDHEPPAPRVRHHAAQLVLQPLESSAEVVADDACVLDEAVLLDDLEVAAEADHVREPAAPGRVDARG